MWNLAQLLVRRFLLCATIARALAVGFKWFCGNNIRQAAYLEKKLFSLMRDLIMSESSFMSGKEAIFSAAGFDQV